MTGTSEEGEYIVSESNQMMGLNHLSAGITLNMFLIMEERDGDRIGKK